jgi:hypothetical protein
MYIYSIDCRKKPGGHDCVRRSGLHETETEFGGGGGLLVQVLGGV